MTVVHEHRTHLMGTTAHLVVVGGHAGLIDTALARLHGLEAAWSRFRSDSELSRLNAAQGAAVVVSVDTALLVNALVAAWEFTGGRFDPGVHDDVVAAGYDRSWPILTASRRAHPARRPTPASCLAERLDADHGLVQLPAGVRLDGGGLGKGLAADLVAADLITAGATGALVSIGGDLRVTGRPPTGDCWTIEVEHPDDRTRVIATVAIEEGGIATSTSARRRWRCTDGTVAHHLIDPATGLPADVPRRQVTAVAGTAAWAEVAAKVGFLDGDPCDPCSGLLVVDDHDRLTTSGEDGWFDLV